MNLYIFSNERWNLKSTVLCKKHWMLVYLFRNFMSVFMSMAMEVPQEQDVVEKVPIQKKTNRASIAVCMTSYDFHINHSVVSITIFCETLVRVIL
jgi:hypothetical protein